MEQTPGNSSNHYILVLEVFKVLSLGPKKGQHTYIPPMVLRHQSKQVPGVPSSFASLP